MRKLISILAILVSLLILACTREHQPLDPKDAGNFVMRPQVDIPWPSLADSPWPMHHGNPQSTGRSRYAGPSQGKVAWRYDSGGQIGTSIVIGADSTIYFGNDNVIKGEEHHSYLNAVRQDGSLKWRFDIGHGSKKQGCSPLLAVDGTIYIGSATGQLFAINPDGTKKWEYFADDVIVTLGMNIGLDGVIYFVTGVNGHLYAINPNGTLKWKSTAAHPFQDLVGLSVAPDGNTLYLGCKGTTENDTVAGLAAVDLNGFIKWIFTTGEVYAPPIIDNEGNLFFDSGITPSKKGIYSLTPDGVLRWKYMFRATTLLGGTMDYNGNVYFVAADENGGFLFAFDHEGRLKWKFDIDQFDNGGQASSLVCDIEGTVFSSSTVQTLYAITSLGQLKWQTTVGQIGWLSPALAFGKIFVGTWQGSTGKSLYSVQ